MNEIALVAGKVAEPFTHFRNKDEVYLAVIENELNLLIDRLKKVIISSLSPHGS